jgi:hypothetical protein
MMCLAIDNPTRSEIHAVIFLHAKNMSALEISCELCVVYGQNVMIEVTVRQWCRMFKDGQTNVYNEEQYGRPSVVSDLVELLIRKFVKDGASQFQNFHVNIHKLHALLCKIITVRRSYHEFCARWLPEMLTGGHKM